MPTTERKRVTGYGPSYAVRKHSWLVLGQCPWCGEKEIEIVDLPCGGQEARCKNQKCNAIDPLRRGLKLSRRKDR